MHSSTSATPDFRSALVLFSGGQDSTTCLAWALARFDRVETIGFSYGQRHAIELEMRTPILDELRRSFPTWGERLGRDIVIPLDILSSLSKSAMIEELPFTVREDGLPSTFVPGRNLLFLTFAAIVAKQRGRFA